MIVFILKRLFLRVIFSRYSLFVCFFVFLASAGRAQILNDSTQNIYGPKTTRYFLEKDVYNSIDTLYSLDTALNAFHRFEFPARYNYLYQDLGNKGSAIQPLFYDPPANIGFRSGFDAYDLYYKDVLDIKFYDTKSPYSKFHYVQGGRGISFLETELSRNVSPNWNLGISFNRLSANSQIQFSPRPENPEVDHYSYSAYTAFKTEDKKYFVDAYFRRMKHEVHENGGVQLLDTFIRDENSQLNLQMFFQDYADHNKELENAVSGDLRINYHLYHQFNFSSLLGVYHLFDFERQRITYEDISAPYNTAFYGAYLIDNTKTQKETTFFKTFRNDIGLKGELDEFKYRLYYRRRNFYVDKMYLPDLDWQKEDIAGGELSVRFSERAVLHLNGEVLGNSTLQDQSNDYKVNFSFENRYIKANWTRGLYSPSYLQKNYFGNHHSWDNSDFSPTLSDDISFLASLPLGIIKVNPKIKASRVGNYMLFVQKDSVVQPAQLEKSLLILSPGFDFHLKLGHFNLRNSFTYNLVESDSFNLPKISENLLLYYERTVTKKAHNLQVGFDVKWMDGYKADAYIPSIQQFYYQNNFTMNPYFLVDVFAAMKINRTRVFVKVSNLTRNHTGDNQSGYLVRPFYYGFVRAMDVGVSWMFFD